MEFIVGLAWVVPNAGFSRPNPVNFRPPNDKDAQPINIPALVLQLLRNTGMGRTITSALFLLALLSLLAGFFLTPAHLRHIAGLLSQTGTVHPALMEKVELVPRLLLLIGLEFCFAALFWEFRGKKISSAFWPSFQHRSISQRAMLGLSTVYLLISLLSLNFYTVSLTNRWIRLSEVPKVPEGLPMEGIPVFQAIQQKTPASARILIHTNQDEKYLLNYLCYPRRFYFYPERDKPLTAIPHGWLQKYKIGWTLEIPPGGAGQYDLQPVSPFEGGHP